MLCLVLLQSKDAKNLMHLWWNSKREANIFSLMMPKIFLMFTSHILLFSSLVFGELHILIIYSNTQVDSIANAYYAITSRNRLLVLHQFVLDVDDILGKSNEANVHVEHKPLSFWGQWLLRIRSWWENYILL